MQYLKIILNIVFMYIYKDLVGFNERLRYK